MPLRLDDSLSLLPALVHDPQECEGIPGAGRVLARLELALGAAIAELGNPVFAIRGTRHILMARGVARLQQRPVVEGGPHLDDLTIFAKELLRQGCAPGLFLLGATLKCFFLILLFEGEFLHCIGHVLVQVLLGGVLSVLALVAHPDEGERILWAGGVEASWYGAHLLARAGLDDGNGLGRASYFLCVRWRGAVVLLEVVVESRAEFQNLAVLALQGRVLVTTPRLCALELLHFARYRFFVRLGLQVRHDFLVHIRLQLLQDPRAPGHQGGGQRQQADQLGCGAHRRRPLGARPGRAMRLD
mmetsp:Transcript_49564/g.111462  ORF Transcript_49564/g.111462 Transcript_49564/m.111462 type:complete len:301 (+) Transcript_49564:48-950(+)